MVIGDSVLLLFIVCVQFGSQPGPSATATQPGNQSQVSLVVGMRQNELRGLFTIGSQ